MATTAMQVKYCDLVHNTDPQHGSFPLPHKMALDTQTMDKLAQHLLLAESKQKDTNSLGAPCHHMRAKKVGWHYFANTDSTQRTMSPAGMAPEVLPISLPS